jgi:hypothetical protein
VKVDPKPEPKVDPKPEVKADPKPEVKVDPKPEPKVDPKPEVKVDPKPEPKVDPKPEAKAEPKADAKPAEGKVEVKAIPEPKAEPKADAKSPPKEEAKAEPKPEAKVDPKPAAKTEVAMGPAIDAAAVKAPQFSTIASAEDLAAQLEILVTALGKAVVDEEEYKSQIDDRFVRDANTVTLVTIALGLHDKDNPVKPNAPAIVAAARNLAGMKDFASTKKAVEELKTAVDGKGNGKAELKWGKVATLKGLMKDEVPAVNKKIGDGVKRLKKRADETAAAAATMALIAENSKLYVADTKKPEEGKKWVEFSAQMQAASRELNEKARAKDEEGAKAAQEKLNQSCHDCHAVFNPEQLKEKEKP